MYFIASLSVAGASANISLLITGNEQLGTIILFASLAALLYRIKTINNTMRNAADSVVYLSMVNLLFSLLSVLWWLK